MNWAAWSLDRIVILFVGLAFLLVGIQVSFFHYRQNFHHKSMWMPVISAPIFFAAGILLVFWNAAWTLNLFILCMWAGAVIGLIGFYRHFKGVGVRVGGWALRNFLIGPPVVLPLVFAAVSVLGLIAAYWR
jgi:hypothetical protein